VPESKLVREHRRRATDARRMADAASTSAEKGGPPKGREALAQVGKQHD
jgi:hypothetical protein